MVEPLRLDPHPGEANQDTNTHSSNPPHCENCSELRILGLAALHLDLLCIPGRSFLSVLVGIAGSGAGAERTSLRELLLLRTLESVVSRDYSAGFDVRLFHRPGASSDAESSVAAD